MIEQKNILGSFISSSDLIKNPALDIQGVEWKDKSVREDRLETIHTNIEPQFQLLRGRPNHKTQFNKSTKNLINFERFIFTSEPILYHNQITRGLIAISEKDVMFTTENGVSLLNTSSGNINRVIQLENAESLDYSKKLGILAGINNDLNVFFWNVHSAKMVSTIEVPFKSQLGNKALVFGDETPRYFLCGNSTKVLLRDLETHKNINKFTADFFVNDLDYEESFKMIAYAQDSEEVLIHDARTKNKEIVLIGHKDFNYAVKFMNWPFIASGGQDISALVWDLRRGDKPFHVLRGISDAITALEFNKDKNYLISAESHSSVFVYNMNTVIPERHKETYFGWISGIALSPSSNSLFASAVDGISGVFKFNFN